MKNFLLLALGSTLCISANAALTQSWSNSVSGLLTESKSFNNPVATDLSGNLFGATVFDGTLPTGGYEAIGTSSLIVKYDAAGTEQWMLPIIGSATVTHLATASAGEQQFLYVAGKYADEIQFISADQNNLTIEGQTIDGAPTVNQNSAFVAQYDAETGNVLAVIPFVPKALSALEETGMYYPMDGDLKFEITNLVADANALYVSALFTGFTEMANGLNFSGTYNDPWGGVYFEDLKGASVFKMSHKNLSVSKLMQYGNSAPLATEDIQTEAMSVTVGLYEGNPVAAFVGNGSLELECVASITDASITKTEINNGSGYAYTVVSLSDSDFKHGTTTAPLSEAFYIKDFVSDFVTLNHSLYLVGSETSDMTVEGDNGDETVTETGIFVSLVNADNTLLQEAMLSHSEQIGDNTVTFETVNNAVVCDNKIYIAAYGYTHGGELVATGALTLYDFSLRFDNTLGHATGFCANNLYLGMSDSEDTGVKFTRFAMPGAGVSAIATPENSNVKYYNLDGHQVDSTYRGIVISSDGKKLIFSK